MLAQPFRQWLPIAVEEDINVGKDVHDDVKALLMPPSHDAKSYRSMFAYGNHIRVRSTEMELKTCDSGVAATFTQSCRASTRDLNVRTANLEYIG
jgi:hypothetical protein